MTTTESIQQEIAAAQRKVKECHDFAELHRLAGYIQGLNIALYVIGKTERDRQELAY